MDTALQTCIHTYHLPHDTPHGVCCCRADLVDPCPIVPLFHCAPVPNPNLWWNGGTMGWKGMGMEGLTHDRTGAQWVDPLPLPQKPHI